ncbi:uncharacterized protein [Leptinotarsa decemlineata]|uniref:uncharacterized protein n=1 Tax=Leptinotarsa decemlineata TaxID=7539 RepID=UPI003D30CE7E
MPLTCIVVSCGSRADRDKVSFFSVPKVTNFPHLVHLNVLSAKRREQWIRSIRRDDLTESKLKYERVCSRHFVQGKPADLQDINNPDWIPNQNMGYSTKSALKRQLDVDRMERLQNRKKMRQFEEVDDNPETNVDSGSVEEINPEEQDGTATQTDLTVDHLNKQCEAVDFLKSKINILSCRLNKTIMTYESFHNDDQKCLYYTGLNFSLLNIVFQRIKPFIAVSSVSALDPFQKFLITMIKLRLNAHFEDLAYRFGISQSTCSTYFNSIISLMYQRFKNLIIWPDKEKNLKNIPSCFKEVFHDKTTVIIDCFEVFIEKASSYVTQQKSWSNYKHHNTVKFYIGITPQGTISYISKAWGGRTSDKKMVELSGFLDKIQSQDIVLADRGFLINDSLATLGAKLVIPAFTKGKKQLLPFELEETRKIAHVRIHIERIIGVIKNKFTIFQGPLPITMLTHVTDDVNIIDKIVVVVCNLINFSYPIIPL